MNTGDGNGDGEGAKGRDARGVFSIGDEAGFYSESESGVEEGGKGKRQGVCERS